MQADGLRLAAPSKFALLEQFQFKLLQPIPSW
jgi:hypothetical protein